MSREEAVKLLQVTRLMLMDGANQPISDLYYALDMAIEALQKADRKTENSSEKPNNCEPQTERTCTNCKHNGVLSVPKCDECHGMDKHEFIEPQTDCAWK